MVICHKINRFFIALSVEPDAICRPELFIHLIGREKLLVELLKFKTLCDRTSFGPTLANVGDCGAVARVHYLLPLLPELTGDNSAFVTMINELELQLSQPLGKPSSCRPALVVACDGV